MMTTSEEPSSVLFEYRAVGQMMRVSAMDESTLTEIVISCPKGLSEGQMQNLALRRLRYVMHKNSGR